MKKIEAIIRSKVFNQVKEALKEAGIEFFSYWDVKGVGMAKEEYWFRGNKYDPGNIERVMLSIVVRDINIDKTVEAILNSAKTGEIGDGKIFVYDIQESYRIRTGEKGPESLFLKDLDKKA